MALSLRALRDRLLAGLLGDAEQTEADRPMLMLDMLSDWLPYRVYDPASRLYVNARSKGFVLGVTPLIGADERTGEILGAFFSEGLPAGACLQILHLASPRISRIVAPWFAPRYEQGGVYEAIARHRAKKLYSMVWKSGASDAPFHARAHQVVISLGVPASRSVSNEELSHAREGLIAMLKSLNLGVIEYEPHDLIALLDDLTSPTTAPQDDAVPYNPNDPIANQAIRRDIELLVHEDRIELGTERFRPTGVHNQGVPEIGAVYPDRFDLRHFAVRNMPPRWAPHECARLIGDLFTDKLRFPCPAATMLCLVYPDQEAAAAKAGFKFMRTTSLSQTRSSRFLPRIAEQSAEWQHVQAELQEGRRLVRVFYGITTWSPLGQGDRHERAVKSIYKAAGWDLSDERYIQIQGLLAAMPLTLADGLGADMERLKRFKTLLSTTAANIAPLQGEYLGGPVPHLLFVGRRGQPFYWSPFENEAGNHNVAICGKSGSGKSVLLQEMCAALRGAGAKVVVIDDGRSFEHSVKLQGGRFIEFTLASGFCLNPFSMIDAARAADDEDYRLDCFAMVKAIVGQMARHSAKLTDTERGLIDRAVNLVWSERQSRASVTQVGASLAAMENETAADLATSLGPFTAGGTYARFFEGQASLDLEADFTVFEMSDLATREELRSVVLSAIMFMTSQAMTRADIQTERTYSSIANSAMKWVPLLNVVLTVLFYALFPVLFPLFLLPKTGPLALKGYVTGFFYLAAWGPLFVILHMMLMYKGAAEMTAVAGTNGLSLATFTGMADVNSDIGLLAGYLIASVPFLAGGVAKGAMAISHQATSYLNPSQNAAEEAAREASTGNVALGNTSLENSTVMTRQFAQGTVAPSFTYGAAQKLPTM